MKFLEKRETKPQQCILYEERGKSKWGKLNKTLRK